MSEIGISWDQEKARENLRQHGVSFEEASAVFADENGRVKHDPEHSVQEDRFLLLGFSARGRVLVVCHAYRRKDEVIRIISARRATRNERRQYGSIR
jgi:uncharacterized DUF497 family protein